MSSCWPSYSSVQAKRLQLNSAAMRFYVRLLPELLMPWRNSPLLNLLLATIACRNVTLTGLPQVETTLDLKFKWAVVELCPSCSFTVQRLAIANERRGNGASVGERQMRSHQHVDNIKSAAAATQLRHMQEC